MENRSAKCCKVLWVESAPGEQDAAREALASDGRFQLTVSRCGAADAPHHESEPAAAQRNVCDVVVTGFSRDQGDPLRAIDFARRLAPSCPVVIATAHGSEALAVAAMRRGAADYVSLSTADGLAELPARILSAVQTSTSNHCAPGAQVDANDRFRQLFEKCSRLLCVVGFDGFVKQTNPIWDRILGYSSDEMRSIPTRELVHLDDAEKAIAVLGELRANRFVKDVEMRIRAKDGGYRTILWNAVPSLEDQVYFVSAHDITERQVAEDRVRESQERFQLIARATNDVVWDWNLRSNEIWHNNAYQHSFGSVGRSAREVINWWNDRIHPDDRSRILDAASSRPVDGHRGWTLEYRLQRLDGTYAYVYDRGFVICDAKGEPARMVGTVVDITRLKEAEARLQESNERFRLVAKATRDAVWDWDIVTGHVWRNEGFATLFGYGLEDIDPTVQWWSERVHPDDRNQIADATDPSVATFAQQQVLHYRFRRADGSYADVVDRGFAMLNAEGTPVRLLGSIMDVSSQRRAEEIAHMQQAELAHSARVRTIGEITTGLAHELNQPLTAIANYAESCAQAIRAKTKDPAAKLLPWVEQIAHNTQRAGDMLRRLRRFARKSEPQRADVDINELVQEVIELLEAEIRVREICVRWKPVAATRARIDRVQVQQVLVNLLSNAFEAVADRSPDDRLVIISANSTDDHVEVAVQDAGGGVPQQHRDRVFEAFFTTKSGGVGIGLAISRSIIEDHGGRIWIEPNNHGGATFLFTLPLEIEHDATIANRVRRRR